MPLVLFTWRPLQVLGGHRHPAEESGLREAGQSPPVDQLLGEHPARHDLLPEVAGLRLRAQEQTWHPGGECGLFISLRGKRKLERKLCIWWCVSCGRTDTVDPVVNTCSPPIQRLFVVPASPKQKEIPFARVNHNKYMVTDKVAYIGTALESLHK